MTLVYNGLSDSEGVTEYKDARFALIERVEGFGVPNHLGELYYDSPDGKLTFGFGFNLQIAARVDKVMAAMGLDLDANAGTVEQGYVTQVRDLITTNDSGPSGYAPSLQDDLND